MWTPDRFYPLGFPGRQAFQVTLGGLAAAFGVGFFRFCYTFEAAKGQLYNIVWVNDERTQVLIDGSVIATFPTLLNGVSLGLVLVALCLLAAILFHYRWHWMGSRSIYRMKLLPHRGDLWRRVLTMPLAGLAACALLWGLLVFLCALIYRFGTPEEHLPLNCWGSFPFTWMGGRYA